MIVKRILQTIVGAPMIQTLFMNDEYDHCNDFIIIRQADTGYSCINIEACIQSIFGYDSHNEVQLDLNNLLIQYPSVIRIEYIDHVAVIICIGSSELYYLDYDERRNLWRSTELKRNTKDLRTYGLHYFLFQLTELQLNKIVKSMLSEDNELRESVFRQFLGCRPDYHGCDGDFRLIAMNMFSIAKTYSNFSQFLESVSDRYDLIRARILDNPMDVVEYLMLPVNSYANIGQLRLRESCRSTLESELKQKYEMLLRDIELIDYDYPIHVI